ncbi:hypothetical protein SALBM135S_03471 [Streptomyces alboniger]
MGADRPKHLRAQDLHEADSAVSSLTWRRMG